MSFLQKSVTLILFLLAINSPAIAQTKAVATVSQNQVLLGDIFILNVEVNDSGSDYQLDTRGLVDKFTVYSPTRSEETRIINGDYSEKTIWSLRLQANKIGTFIIPSLQIGNVKTDPIKIQVKEPTEQQQSTIGKSIFIENTISQDKVYLGQPVIVESKIFISERIHNGDIQPPVLAGAEIERIDNEQQTQTVRNGIRYQLLTYQYQITPSITGEQTITSPLLSGAVRKQSTNNWRGSDNYEQVNIRGNNLTLTIKEIPAEFKGDWLVSEDVRLIENNDLTQQKYTVGEPITRSISLQVASLPIEKMPEIKINYDSSLRYYPDQDDLQQGTVGGVLYSQRTITHAIIASHAGEITLPEIRIPWWNSKTEKQEYAVLPAQTLTIAPSTQVADSTTSYIPSQKQVTITDTPPANTESNITVEENSKALLFWKISTFTLLTLLILLVLYHFKKLNINKKLLQVPVNKDIKSNKYYEALLNSLKKEQANETYLALLRYFQYQQPTLTKIQQIESFTRLDDDYKQKMLQNLQMLELACSNKSHQWNAKELLELIKMHHKITQNKKIAPITNINP